MGGDIGVKSNWRALRGIEKRRVSEARLQAHHAAQWLARVARAYIPPQPDDSHTSLIWDRAIDGFRTQTLKNGASLSLQVGNLTLALRTRDESTEGQTIHLSGRTDLDVRQWLGDHLSKMDVDPGSLDAPSPYEIPAHAIGQGAPYDAADLADALNELAAWFANADKLIGTIQSQLIERKLGASPVCCWPHHFDLATLAMLPARDADTGYVGVGLSPGDEYYDEPYFYVSVYPEPDRTMLPALPMLGHWHTHEFMAAIVPAHKIVSSKNQESETAEFLRSAVDVALKIVMR